MTMAEVPEVGKLAIDGGPPVRTRPFAPWPYFEDDEIAAVERVLRSGRVNYWTGPEGQAFEREFAAFCGSDYAIALANGTVAIELALAVLGVGPHDDVIVPSRTFIATASAVVMRGGRPIVADVDPISQNITAESIAAVLTPATKAVIVVHLAGWPCDMDAINELAASRGIRVIEDCAQSLGATYKGRHVGTLGDIGTFSFCQDKIMTTAGEGGMLVTNDSQLWERAWSFKDHGKDYGLAHASDGGTGVAFKWLHNSFGTNWRMTEVQSAQGRIALAKVPTWVGRRKMYGEFLDSMFKGSESLRITPPPDGYGHSYYKYYVFVRPESLRPDWSRDRIAQAVAAEGIPCFTGACPEIYREQAFTERGFEPEERLPNARELGETSLMFLVHPTLAMPDIEDTARAVLKVLEVATR